MNEEEAVSRVEEWLAGRNAEGTGALRVRRDYVVRAANGWNVTYNTVGWLDGTDPGTGLFPSPVVFVPDDGGEISLDLKMMASSAAGSADDENFTKWVEVVDPEFDHATFRDLPVPKAAILRWEQHTLYDQPTGVTRKNPDHRPGPLFIGHAKPESDFEKLLGYFYAGWITPEQFVHWMLDLDVLAPVKDGHPQVRDCGQDGVRFIVYTSEARMPTEYTMWERVQPRVLLRRAKDVSGVGLVVNSGRNEPFVVYPEMLTQAIWLGLPAKAERVPSVEGPAFLGAEYATALKAIYAELGQEAGGAITNLADLVEQARNNGFPLSTDELVRYTRSAGLSYKRSRAKYDRRPLPEMPEDLFAYGLVTHFDDDGEPRPMPWKFGKFFNPTIRVETFAYPRLVGAYVGFALGDALGSGADPAGGLPLGGLTRQLLFHTESVIRGLEADPDKAEIPASLPVGGRPGGWVVKATANAGPAPMEFSSMLVTALAATVTRGSGCPADVPDYAMKVVRELVGSAADPEVVHGAELLVRLFRAQLAARNGVPAVANFLEASENLPGEVGGLVKTVLDLRNDLDGDDIEQFDSIGDGRTPLSVLGRALFAAAKRGHDPEAALKLAARGGPVTGALTGAMVGARLMVPGLPEAWLAAFGALGVVDNMADDAYYYFNRFGLTSEPEEQRQWDAARYPRGDQSKTGDGGTRRGSREEISKEKREWLQAPATRSRLRGSLFAGAIGDALGAKTEFDSIDRIRQIAGPDGITDLIPAYGGVGRITDDTQMTLFTLEGLIRANARKRKGLDGTPVEQSLQMAYQRWLHTQGVAWDQARGPHDRSAEADGWLLTNRELFSRRAPGLTCFSELENYGRTGVRAGIDKPINNSKGSGGVMRAAPIALWSDDLAEVFRLGAESAALTHGHPSGYLSSGAFAVIVHELLQGKPLLDAVATARGELEKYRGHEEQSIALDQALALAGQGAPTPEKLETLGQGNIGETALSMSVYVALTTTDANSALLASVNHSGDSDSTGSVCGNLVGAMYGEQALRPDWLAKLELADVIGQLADDALAEFGPDAPDDDRWYVRYPAY